MFVMIETSPFFKYVIHSGNTISVTTLIHEMENYPGNSSTRITSSNIPRIELQKETAAELEDEEK